MNGKVKWFEPKKGFGFITKDEGGDVFVHYTSILNPHKVDGATILNEGDKVEFDEATGPKGPKAVNVRVL